MTSRQRFLAACRCQPVDRPPIWLLRQAGRYMAEYRAVRAHHTLLEICRTPALAAEVTITAAERLGVDAAIIFADLLLPAAPLELKLEFTTGEGPRLAPPLRTPEQIARLPELWGGALDFVSEAIARVRRHFGPDGLPVIGFAGAPFTLASYLIEGGSSRNFLETKRLLHNQPRAWDALMRKLTAGLAGFLEQQAAAGADALHIFDSWAGALSPEDYRRAVLPHTRRLVEQAGAGGVPVIYFSTGTAGFLEAVAATGAAVLGLDWRVDLGAAWRQLDALPRPAPALQGNLDPALLLASPEAVRAAARGILEQARGRDGFIFNLGHGILPETPVEHVLALIECVQAGC